MTGREELVARLELEALRPTSRWAPDPVTDPDTAARIRELVELVAMVARTSSPAPAPSPVMLAARRAPHAAPAAVARRRRSA